jgi:hypothetical protein
VAACSRNKISNHCAGKSGSDERKSEESEKQETAGVEVLVLADVISGNKHRRKDEDVGD